MRSIRATPHAGQRIDTNGCRRAVSGPGSPISKERRTLVDRARESWIAKLIDLSRRTTSSSIVISRLARWTCPTLQASRFDALLQSGAEGATGVTLRKLVANQEEELRARRATRNHGPSVGQSRRERPRDVVPQSGVGLLAIRGRRTTRRVSNPLDAAQCYPCRP